MDKAKYQNDFRQVGLRVAYFRKQKGYTQESFAEKMGVGVSYIGSIEAPGDFRKISLTTLFRVAEALGVPAYKLLQFD
ncbi:MAG: helix-turn-helix transcriptional regulator [Oscillospiraceae bacterium]|nr:helix-turn-helix transcriptional regulator [Oscillospiraceae bacterium]